MARRWRHDVPRNWDQRHALGAGIGWNNDRWELSSAVTWRSGWPITPITLETTVPVPTVGIEGRNSARLGSYFTVDLRAARRFAFERSLLTVYLEVTNATNRHNDCCTEYEYNTEDGDPHLETDTAHYLMALPNLGFVWEF